MSHLFLHEHLDAAARRSPGALAVEDRAARLTYADLDAAARGVAAALADQGVRPGDRIALLMENSARFAAGFWGAVYAGAVVTPLNPETRPEKLAYILADCTPSAVLADPDLSEAARRAGAVAVLDPAAVAPRGANGPPPAAGRAIDQDLGALVYTSGSTGAPKGVMLSHQNLATASRSVATYLGYRASDRILVALPLTFDYGMHQLTMAALVGAAVIVERDFSKPLYALSRAQHAGATVLPLVPTMVPLINALAPRFDLSAVRIVTSTAAALAPRAIDRLQELFPQARVFSMYGLTECHRCTYLPPEELARRKGSVGIAIPNTELWVVDGEGVRHRRDATGELVIRGATVMKGYWNKPEATARRLRPGLHPGEHVLHTGDLVRLDADGFAYFIARSDDVLKVKGEKVAPKEVEDALLAHPHVAEAVAYGAPDPVMGHVLRAVVVPAAGCAPTEAELLAWCEARLEPIAVPRGIALQPAFARTPNGKIDRARLMEELA